MKELSLFSGAGGGLLGTKHLLGWECVGYVEIEPYCQEVLKARIADGYLDPAPIFGDIRKFISEGYAEAYQGMVDVVTGGFPCQDIAVCKKDAEGIWGKRSGLWREMAEVLRIVRPEYAFVENSPALTFRGLGEVLRDLAAMGFDARWGVLGGYTADSCCEGERLWVVASQTDSTMLESLDLFKHQFACQEEPCRRQYSRAVGSMLSQDDYTNLKRDSNEVAQGMDRLKAIGNGQVPKVAQVAWEVLSGDGDEQ
jgi:DNA (cytosine-5)-methyltransferase 1